MYIFVKKTSPFFHSMDQNDNSCPEFWLIFSEDCVNLNIKDHITLKQELSKIPWFLFMYEWGNYISVDSYLVNSHHETSSVYKKTKHMPKGGISQLRQLIQM